MEKAKILNLPQGMTSIACCVCQMVFAVTDAFHRARTNDHHIFYCPVGHAQSYKNPEIEVKKEQESTTVTLAIETLQWKVKALEEKLIKKPRPAWWGK